MFDWQTTAFLLDAAAQAEGSVPEGAPLTLIPIAIGTICGLGVAGFFMRYAMKKGEQDRRNDPNRFKRLK